MIDIILFRLHVLFQIAEKPETAAKEYHNSPRVASFISTECAQYFVFAENDIICEVNSLSAAVITFFSCYYVFHLIYPKEIKNVLLFFQDYLLQRPDSQKRSATYLAVAADIKRQRQFGKIWTEETDIIIYCLTFRLMSLYGCKTINNITTVYTVNT